MGVDVKGTGGLCLLVGVFLLDVVGVLLRDVLEFFSSYDNLSLSESF